MEIRPDRNVYNREHLIIALLGAALMYGVLVYVGNPFPWTGIVGSFIAIFIRWIYVASEAMDNVWILTDKRLYGPSERSIPLGDIDQARSLLSATQIITDDGEKYMIKYLANPKATAARILATRNGVFK
jgi:hypothetical protein